MLFIVYPQVICWLFFFFQAEDGIRDDLVTGVQTCALPICAIRVNGLFISCCSCWLIVRRDRKSTRLNSSHQIISYAVFCLKKKKTKIQTLVRQKKKYTTTTTTQITENT